MKRYNSLYAVVSAVSLWGILFLAGCANVVTGPQQDSTGKVTISVIGEGAAPRTLYPNAQFSKYELSFTPKEGQAYKEPIPLRGTDSAVIEDLNGDWEITAVGYVEIWVNGELKEFAAAEGTGTLSAGEASLSIPISATQEGPDGYFSWDIGFPAEKVDNAYLHFTQVDGNQVDLSGDSYIPYNENLSRYHTGQYKIAPGYYLVRVVLENGYQRTGYTEVVHIYSNMETRADYTYTEEDFTDFITLSGTVTVNGSPPSSAYVNLYGYQNREGPQLGEGYVNSADGTWSIAMDPLASPTTLYAWVQGDIIDGSNWGEEYAGEIADVFYQSIPNIDLDLIVISSITLSGTANVTINGSSPIYAPLTLYDNQNREDSQLLGYGYIDPADGTWSITMDSFVSPTTLYVWVNASDGSNWGEEYAGEIVGVSSVSISDIVLGDIAIDGGGGSGDGSKPTALSANASFDEVIAKLDAIISYADTPQAVKASAGESKSELTQNESTFRRGWSSMGGSYVTTINVFIDTIFSDNAAITNANLESLSVSVGTLSPAFDEGTTAYTILVLNTITSITVTAAVADTGKATLIQSPGTIGSPVSLDPGANTITITVTAEDEITTRDYIITVIRINPLSFVFTGFNDQTIDLTKSHESDLSRSTYDQLEITLNEDWDSDTTWYVDGRTWGSSVTTFSFSSTSFAVGEHTVTKVVYKNSVPYSKTLSFRVVK